MIEFWTAENVVAIENHRRMRGGVYGDYCVSFYYTLMRNQFNAHSA